MRNRFLVIARVGDRSLHPAWLRGATPEFDLFLSYFGDEPDRYRDDCAHYHRKKGGKWPVLGELVEEHREVISGYDAVWLPDDDLLADAATLNRMFALVEEHGLALAQPALTPDSYYTFSELLQRGGTVLRYVNFVEVMAPVMSRASLSELGGTFAQSASGWGLDRLWPKLVQNPDRKRIAILDAAPVTHTRPVGGELYRKNPELRPAKDIEALAARYPELDLSRGSYRNRFRVYGEFPPGRTGSDAVAVLRGKWQKLTAELRARRTPRYGEEPRG